MGVAEGWQPWFGLLLPSSTQLAPPAGFQYGFSEESLVMPLHRLPKAIESAGLEGPPGDLDASLTKAPGLASNEIASPARLLAERASAPTRVRRADPDEKLRRELQAFESQKSEGRLQGYAGRFVAIHKGKVVDSDENEFRLLDRLRALGRREGPIAICRIPGPDEATPAVIDDPRFDSPRM
jgi:hypothetical protein